MKRCFIRGRQLFQIWHLLDKIRHQGKSVLKCKRVWKKFEKSTPLWVSRNFKLEISWSNLVDLSNWVILLTSRQGSKGNIGPCRGLNCAEIMRRLIAFTQVNNYQEITFEEYLISCQMLVDREDNFFSFTPTGEKKIDYDFTTNYVWFKCKLNVNQLYWLIWLYHRRTSLTGLNITTFSNTLWIWYLIF